MTRHMLFIPVEGETRMVVAESFAQMKALIVADTIERVRVGIDWALCVDESGRYTDKPVNPRASILYGVQMHGTPIVGDALLGMEGFVSEGDPMTAGVDWIDTSEEQARAFLRERAAE